MSLLAGLETSTDIEEEKDTIGGGGYLLESGVYPMTVELAYVHKSKGGAMALNLHLKADTGQVVRTQFWMTGGNAKGNKNYYEKDGKRSYLPGFNQANALALLTVGKEISALGTENKTVKLYNYTVRKETLQPVDVVTELLGQAVTIGIVKQVVDKNVKNAEGDYVPSGETREENEVSKIFRTSDNLTVAEIKAEVTEGAFYEAWKENNTGKTVIKAKGAQGTSGTPTGSDAPKKKLFS